MLWLTYPCISIHGTDGEDVTVVDCVLVHGCDVRGLDKLWSIVVSKHRDYDSSSVGGSPGGRSQISPCNCQL